MRRMLRRWSMLLALALAASVLTLSLAEDLDLAPEEGAGALQIEAMPGEATLSEMPGAPEIAANSAGEADVLGAIQSNGKPKKLKLAAKKITLGVGEKFDLKATLLDADGEIATGKLKYSSAKKKYASVSKKGVIKGRKKGSTKITVTGPGGLKAVCKVTVRKAPKSVKVTARKAKLSYEPEAAGGESTTLKVKLSSGSASAITYSGYDPAVIRVSGSGKVTAVGYGTTSVKATAFNGKHGRCTIRVVSPDDAGTINVAHRGGAGYWPENTLKAFKKTASTGANAVELDVQSTKDGVQVVHHDEYITAKGKRVYINGKKYKDLKQLKPSLCTLDEALEVISHGKLGLYLELKETANAADCVASVNGWGMQGRTMYISFYESRLRDVRRIDGAARLGYIFHETPSNIDALNAELRLSAIGQDRKYLTQSHVAKWQSKGLLVNVWTANDKKDIKKYLKWGVDSITSDYPKRVRDVLKK